MATKEQRKSERERQAEIDRRIDAFMTTQTVEKADAVLEAMGLDADASLRRLIRKIDERAAPAQPAPEQGEEMGTCDLAEDWHSPALATLDEPHPWRPGCHGWRPLRGGSRG